MRNSTLAACIAAGSLLAAAGQASAANVLVNQVIDLSTVTLGFETQFDQITLPSGGIDLSVGDTIEYRVTFLAGQAIHADGVIPETDYGLVFDGPPAPGLDMLFTGYATLNDASGNALFTTPTITAHGMGPGGLIFGVANEWTAYTAVPPGLTVYSFHGFGTINSYSDGATTRHFTGGIFDLVADRASAVLPDAVPEPSTWALMLLGFGAAGAGLRARRRQLV